MGTSFSDLLARLDAKSVLFRGERISVRPITAAETEIIHRQLPLPPPPPADTRGSYSADHRAMCERVIANRLAVHVAVAVGFGGWTPQSTTSDCQRIAADLRAGMTDRELFDISRMLEESWRIMEPGDGQRLIGTGDAAGN